MCADQRESFHAEPLPPPPAQEQVLAQIFDDDNTRWVVPRTGNGDMALPVRLADLVTT